jgi:hypothetical protein
MECPHCQQETDPTLIYCKKCGEQIELDPAAVHEALRRDEERDAIEIMEQQSRVAIYLALFLLATTFGLRIAILKSPDGSVSAGYFAPARTVEEKNLEPGNALEMEPLTIDIPEEPKLSEYIKRCRENR